MFIAVETSWDWAVPSSAQAGFKLILGGGAVGWVKVEIKAISAQPTEVGVGLSWAELGNKLDDWTQVYNIQYS